MKLKRALLLTWAGVQAILMCVAIYWLRQAVNIDRFEFATTYYLNVASYVSNVSAYIKNICILAVVDFLFCVGSKNYSKSMLAIAITMVALSTMLLLVSTRVGTSTFIRVIYEDLSMGIAYCYLWLALTTLPYVALALVYILVKAKFLKSSKQTVATQDLNR